MDTSGSMQQVDRMGIAREAAKTIVDTLNIFDYFAVVTFNSVADTLGMPRATYLFDIECYLRQIVWSVNDCLQGRRKSDCNQHRGRTRQRCWI